MRKYYNEFSLLLLHACTQGCIENPLVGGVKLNLPEAVGAVGQAWLLKIFNVLDIL